MRQCEAIVRVHCFTKMRNDCNFSLLPHCVDLRQRIHKRQFNCRPAWNAIRIVLLVARRRTAFSLPKVERGRERIKKSLSRNFRALVFVVIVVAIACCCCHQNRNDRVLNASQRIEFHSNGQRKAIRLSEYLRCIEHSDVDLSAMCSSFVSIAMIAGMFRGKIIL